MYKSEKLIELFRRLHDLRAGLPCCNETFIFLSRYLHGQLFILVIQTTIKTLPMQAANHMIWKTIKSTS